MSENKSIFREKSIERVSSPEKLNDYIRVSSPSVWLIMGAIIVLLLGLLIWSVFGTVTMNKSDGSSEVINPISFVVN
ncbi:MAG: hypothetical protein K6F99_06070 [Lachnospiraceae bacterium]|nr:hypothetical protein [Lachnospiraceae bacterium]